MSTPRPPQPRVVAVAYGTLAMLLLVVLAGVALVVRPPSPPAVAEFSPTDPERIEEVQEEQSSRFGTGGEGTCVDAACTARRPAAREGDSGASTTVDEAIDGSRVRRCVGDPPRQAEDPQSPPCINYWAGDNGGATTTGVTANEIRVAVRNPQPVTERLAGYFNRRFELYGRSLRIVPLGTGGDVRSPTAQRALAAKADEQRVFAALGFDSQAYDTRPLADELARRQIVWVDRQSRLTADELREGGARLWQYSPAIDDGHRAVVRLACTSLAGRQAEYGGPDVAVRRRKFAVLYKDGNGAAPPTRQLVDGLRGCQGSDPEVAVVEFPQSAGDADYRRELTRLALDGVTTLLCLCFEGDRIAAMRAAQSNSYLPEWLLTGLIAGENPRLYVDHVPAEQRAHVFGLAADNKFLRPVDDPWHFAVKEVDPAFELGDQDRHAGQAYETYQQLLLLASGIQLAGPHLTPATFQAALLGARFPNPDAGRSPLWQASVGFRGDRTMADDFTLVWWDEAANAGGDPRGGFCYVDRGARHAPGAWPNRAMRFFDKTGPCR